MKEYHPHEKTRNILNWTLERVKSVPYDVTLRWAFYRCVQELGLTKGDWKSFKGMTSRARKRFWNGWNPSTFVDKTREITRLGGGWKDYNDWVKSFKDEEPVYEKFSSQDNFVLVLFEAKAMISQIKHYATKYHVPYAPFKGDPSIPLKWKIAEFLADLVDDYGRKPIKVLYFGDYEPVKKGGSQGKGIRIPLDALKDIRPWYRGISKSKGIEEPPEIEYIRCGLNQEHVNKWDIPENPTREGEYQWEALNDQHAGQLIKNSVEKVWSLGPIKEIKKQEKNDAREWEKQIEDLRPVSGSEE